jgi:drug/metabolite transporter (DMT)-like permease
MTRAPITGAAAALAAMIALGTSFAATAELADYPVVASQALRYGIAALALAALTRFHVRRPTCRDGIRLGLLAATGLAGFNGFLIAALRQGDAASVGAVVGCVPVVLAAVTAVRRRSIETRVVVAATVVAAGAAVVQGFGGAMTPAGMGYSLGALGCEAAFSLLAAPLAERLGVVGVTLWASALAVPMLLGAGLVAAQPAPGIPSATEFVAVGYLGLVVTAGAFCLWYASILRLGVDRAGLFTGIVPVSALAAAVALGQSHLTLPRALGASAVAAGIAIGMSTRRPKTLGVSRWDRSPHEPVHQLGEPRAQDVGLEVRLGVGELLEQQPGDRRNEKAPVVIGARRPGSAHPGRGDVLMCLAPGVGELSQPGIAGAGQEKFVVCEPVAALAPQVARERRGHRGDPFIGDEQARLQVEREAIEPPHLTLGRVREGRLQQDVAGGEVVRDRPQRYPSGAGDTAMRNRLEPVRADEVQRRVEDAIDPMRGLHIALHDQNDRSVIRYKCPTTLTEDTRITRRQPAGRASP